MTEEFERIVDRAFHQSVIHGGDIPAIDLYMDQIITLIEDKYAPNKRREGEKLLTKTMVNNYSKEGLIKPIKGKKYSKEHILQMLVIYGLKNTLSIGEVKQVLRGLYAQEHFDGKALEKCYEHALAQGEKLGGAWQELIQSQLADETQGGLTAVFEDLLVVTALAQSLKKLAEGIVDAYFPAEEEK